MIRFGFSPSLERDDDDDDDYYYSLILFVDAYDYN